MMPHFRPLSSPLVIIKALIDVLVALALIWFATGPPTGVRLFVALVGILSALLLWFILTAPYCYFTAHLDSLKKGSTSLRMRVHPTGHIKKLKYAVVRWGVPDSAPDWIVNPDAVLEDLNKGSGDQHADNKPISIPANGGLDVDIQCTAGDDGWKQRLTLVRQEDGSLTQEPIVLRPDFGPNIYPEKPLSRLYMFGLIPVAVLLLLIGHWIVSAPAASAQSTTALIPSPPPTITPNGSGNIENVNQTGTNNIANTGSNNTFNIGPSPPPSLFIRCFQKFVNQKNPKYPYVDKITCYSNVDLPKLKLGMAFDQGDILDKNAVVTWGGSGMIDMPRANLATATRTSDNREFPAIQLSYSAMVPPIGPDNPLFVKVQSSSPLHAWSIAEYAQ